MHTAVIIPFRHGDDQTLLAWTLAGYAEQQLVAGHTIEVRVGLDGAAEGQFSDIEMACDPNGPVQVLLRNFPRMGAAAVRNALVRDTTAQTDLLIFGNADARPAPDMVQRHADAMAKLPPRSMVLGSAPWEKPRASTVFDALLADTPMIFFYNQLTTHTWHDFRHVWTLNLSVRLPDFLECGGFHEELRPVYYEDLGLGYRMFGSERKGVWYEPTAQVLHRHPTSLEQYLDREELLGLMSPVLVRVCPEAFAAIHGTSDTLRLAADFQKWVMMDRSLHQWIYRRLAEWAALPESAIGAGEDRQRMLMTIYQMHIPLKRLAFRLGFLHGIALADDIHWQSRRPQSLWRKVLQP